MPDSDGLSRRQAAALATAFLIVPRHVLGKGFVAPSDKITIASIGLGRQGMAVTMDLLAHDDVRIIAVCDCNRGSNDYVEYGKNDLLRESRKLLGTGYENWGEDLASQADAQFTQEFSTGLGSGGREPGQRLVQAFYDSRKLSKSGGHKGCAQYADYRELLDNEPGVDAVYVATPDHWHAAISIAAMRKGKHVLCQKPMTHSIADARRVAQTARETNVATSVTINNPSTNSTDLIAQWIDHGAIGHVREVHNWSSRPFWPQGVDRPKEVQPAPEGLDWDMWLGPAPERPFNKAYLPFVWRGWYDFGDGSFGDMGCYSFAGIFKILDLTPPTAVESSGDGVFAETFPKASLVSLDFPSNGKRRALRMHWYDGGLRPPRPAGLKPEDQRLFSGGEDNEGVMYVGDKGILLAEFNGDHPRVYPESRKHKASTVRPALAPDAQHHDQAIDQWLAACKGGPAPLANFHAQAPVTEAFLLGCIAQRFPGESIQWDTTSGHIVNSPKLDAYVNPPRRDKYRV